MDDIIYYVNSSGDLYMGDMLPGDRTATWEEVCNRLGHPYSNACALALARIKAARDKRLSEGGLVWQGYLVSIDKEATDRMTSTALQFMVGALDFVRWKMSDGAYADLDQAAFLAMSAAAGAVVQECYAVEEAKRREALALSDAAAVLAWLDSPANLLTGWPGDGS